MPSLFKPVTRTFAGDQRGTSVVLFAVIFSVLVMTSALAVTYAEVGRLRNALQAAADNAALVGATTYTTSASASAASAAATALMNKRIPTLPTNNGPTFTVTTAAVTTPTPGYQVSVQATSSRTLSTFAAFLPATFTVKVQATSSNPNVTATMSAGSTSGCRSSASDHNVLYYYKIPAGSSSTWLPSTSSLVQNVICDNQQQSQQPVTLSGILATDQIGFALKNITGGLSGYGTNGYGAKQGSTHWFYSHISSPSADADDSSDEDCDQWGRNCTNPEHYPSNSNCSLQVGVVSSSGAQPSFPVGSCSSSAPKYAAPTCQQVNGQTLVYAWNDMGGGRDDKDYNDAMFQLTCGPSGGSGPATISLIH